MNFALVNLYFGGGKPLPTPTLNVQILSSNNPKFHEISRAQWSVSSV